ncbi:MAG: hypothetical protein KGJ14_03510 [Nitrospirota bacterium]|nr:hypothetical protein [Nitrospirota bacterium]
MFTIQPRWTFHISAMLACLWCAGFSTPSYAARLTVQPDNVFASFTAHIGQQIQADKVGFARAQTCTEWFYRQQQKKPATPPVLGVSFPSPHAVDHRWIQSSDCPSQYPGGLNEAREDFSRTQSSLSLSLTFYEFALVGDENDDGRYSPREIQDILESFGLSFRPGDAPATQAAILNAQFDTVRKAGGLDALMASMSVLYDKGYRFTAPDRDALNRISG